MKASRANGLTAPQIASFRIFSAGIVFLPFAVFHISNSPIGPSPTLSQCVTREAPASRNSKNGYNAYVTTRVPGMW